MDLTIPLTLVSVLMVLLGLKDLLRKARDVLPYALGVEAVLLGAVTAFILLPPSAFTAAVLLTPIVLVPLVWARMDRLIPRRVEAVRDRLLKAAEAGEARFAAHDRLDRIEGQGGDWATPVLGGLLGAFLGIGGISYGSGIMMTLAAACLFLPVARLARMSVGEGEVSFLKRALLAPGLPPVDPPAVAAPAIDPPDPES